MNNNIFFPSFKLEKKTKALNIPLWGFVGLISMFSTFLFAEVPYLCLCSIFDIESAFVLDNLSVILCAFTILFALIFGVGLYKFLNTLLYSYKFENNQIIKGKIINPEKVKGIDLAFDTIMTTHMAKNIANSKSAVAGNAAINMNSIITLIKLNTNQEFVNKFFDTDIYKKKIYNNPKLLKETKYNLVYICEGNKKLVIPKLYEGMNISQSNSGEKSLLSRVLVRSLIVLCVFFLFSMIDLFIGIGNNDEYKSNINNTCEMIQSNLNDYGYSITRNCNFEKKVSSDRTSTIEYKIDKNGNITKVSLDLFYDVSSYSSNELRYIISTLLADFSNDETNDFVDQVNSCVNGNCKFGTLGSLRIGSSGGFVNIHNY